MSVWDDMARDAGYRGDEAKQAAAMLEEDARAHFYAGPGDCQRPDCGRPAKDPVHLDPGPPDFGCR